MFNWNENVHIFGPAISKVEVDGINIYGYSFDDFYYTNPAINSFQLEDKSKLNILITHGSLDGGYDDERVYNPMSSNKLRQLGFDYVALGHIHKSNYTETETVVYPGSTISMGFDELGPHGMVVGDISKEQISTKFISLDESEFVITNIDVTDLNNMEELVEKITSINLEDSNYYEVCLIGNRAFDIDMYNLRKMINISRIIKIKNNTKPSVDWEKLINENTLKGLFVKEVLERMNSCSEGEKAALESALDIGLDILDK